MLLTSYIRGHLLSLKFHPQMVTGIQHLQTPISSSMAQKMHFQRAQNYTTVIKSACTQNAKEARAHAPVKNSGKAHMHPMHDCGCKKPRTPSERRINDFGQPPTHFWFISQVDLTPKSKLNPSGGLVKDLEVP
jgi:hypothetical protein